MTDSTTTINKALHAFATKEIGAIENVAKEIKHSLWDHPIFTIDNSSITLGNIVIAICFSFVGIVLLLKLRSKLKCYLHRKFAADKDAANALENVITYIVFIIFIAVVMEIANIPLSTFAFVGGALAIGVGLGAQNLFNNFISSLIIMIEKPVKIGDTIEIDNIHGVVSSIGSRCITISTSKMTDVLVPNSKIIQDNLTNWTLLDHKIRGFIDVRFYKNELCRVGKELTGVSVSIENLQSDLNYIDKQNSFTNKPEEIKKKIKKVLESIKDLKGEPDPEIYFSGVDNYYYNYIAVFIYDGKKVEDFYRLKSDINIALSKNFDMDNMVIEHRF